MTNFRQARSSGKRGGNNKDGHRSDRRQTKKQTQAAEDQWLVAGFELVDWNKWTYTWDHPDGKIPVFKVAPGTVSNDTGTHAGLVAQYALGVLSWWTCLFPYGTPPADIAARLNDEILAIMRHDADVDGPPLDWKPAGEWIDVDAWMAA